MIAPEESVARGGEAEEVLPFASTQCDTSDNDRQRARQAASKYRLIWPCIWSYRGQPDLVQLTH